MQMVYTIENGCANLKALIDIGKRFFFKSTFENVDKINC